jgi:hypothetical protein
MVKRDECAEYGFTYAGAKAASQAGLFTENVFMYGPTVDEASKLLSLMKVKGASFVINSR